jgi:hypothetical protein
VYVYLYASLLLLLMTMALMLLHRLWDAMTQFLGCDRGWSRDLGVVRLGYVMQSLTGDKEDLTALGMEIFPR